MVPRAGPDSLVVSVRAITAARQIGALSLAKAFFFPLSLMGKVRDFAQVSRVRTVFTWGEGGFCDVSELGRSRGSTDTVLKD